MRAITITRLYHTQLKLVLDLATQEGCKAWLDTEMVYPPSRRWVLTGLNVE